MNTWNISGSWREFGQVLLIYYKFKKRSINDSRNYKNIILANTSWKTFIAILVNRDIDWIFVSNVQISMVLAEKGGN